MASPRLAMAERTSRATERRPPKARLRPPVVLALLLAVLSQLGAGVVGWESRVAPSVLAQAIDGEAEFLVHLRARADLSPAVAANDPVERRRWIVSQLQQTAIRSQAPLLRLLTRHGAAHRSFWAANFIWARGDLDLVRSLARQPGVLAITANTRLPGRGPEPVPSPDARSPQGIEWNVAQVGAPEAWARGVTGRGVVVAGQDTGYAWQHPALLPAYRGWDGLGVDHNFNWHDAIHENNPITPPDNPCGYDSPVPCDDDGHGSHTMGIMVGDDGAGNSVGVAPGARWIGCRNMEERWGTVATYTECFQWFLAPTDLNDNHPAPELAPHVIDNSWACPDQEGCSDVNVLLEVVESVRAAGILVVTSAGNSGDSCATVAEPPAIYDAAFSIGATADNADTVATYSSRGPVLADGSGRLKPDLMAPGSNVRSSVPPDGYSVKSGTSMSAPHVAGVAALILEANPALIGRVDLIETILRQSAIPLPVAQECGGVPGSDLPNNTTGYGRVDASAAIDLARTPPGWQSIYQPLIVLAPAEETGGAITP